jgi:hypothetical protein
MTYPDKRKYARYTCSIKSKFYYYVGNPDEIDINIDLPQKGDGIIMDISRGGVLLTSNTRVPVGMPVILKFPFNKQKMDIRGDIVRTGLLKNNPTEIAKKFSIFSSKGDSYIAVEFNEPINEFDNLNLN